MLRELKPARNEAIRTGLIIGLLALVGCQQNPTRPPVVDVPRPTTTDVALGTETSKQPTASIAPADDVDIAATRPQERWESRVREIARTDLSQNEAPLQAPLRSEQLGMPSSADTASEQLNIARLEFTQEPPELRVQRLNAIDFEALNQTERAETLRLKAEALRQLNLSIAALRVEAERIIYLDPADARTEISRVLQSIEALPPLIRGDLASGTDTLAGFASAWIMQDAPDAETTARWLRRFSEHPLLTSQLARFGFLREVTPPDTFHITVLLPLSGELANAGRAIRDGLLYSFAANQERLAIELNIQDSNALSEDQLKVIATGQSTEFIIGPLQRDKIAQLLAMNPNVPVLALNRFETSALSNATTAPVYSLSLAIEDDAESAVDYVGAEFIHPRLLTLYTDSVLGHRAAEAIDDQLKAIGGTSAGQFVLDGKKPETTISQALGVTDSLNRKRELSRTLNLALEHTPRIRQDLSTVVVQTDVAGARQLRPLLDFYYLENTPVLFIGAFRADLAEMTEDFKRSRILATPWELNSPTRAALSSRPLAQGPFGTLTAIGKDALEMTLRLGFGDTTTFAGETGFLQLGNQGVIERRLGTMNINNQEQISYSLWQPTPVTPLMYQDDDYAR